MKNKFILLLLLILIIGNISAMDLDNIKRYDSKTKTATISNSVGLFGIGIKTSGIIDITLKTPQDNHVARGYQKVAEVEINSYSNYENLIKSFELIDLKIGKNIDRKIDLKYLVYNEVDNYKIICEDKISKGINGSIIKDKNCYNIKDGKKKVEEWKEFNNSIKIDNKIIVGLFTNVQKGDRVEWIPNIAGVKINEWATWTESLNTNLISYYKLDEQDTTGTGNILDSALYKNGTNNGANNQTGKLETAYQFVRTDDTTGDYINLNNNFNYTTALTISGWFRDYGNGGWRYAIGKGNDFVMGNGATEWSGFGWGFYDGTWHNVDDGNDLTNNTWTFVVGTYDGTTMRLYKNGLNVANTTYSGSIPNTPAKNWILGGADTTPYYPYDGTIDEVGFWNRVLTSSEILELYNNGDGISYGNLLGVPEITLNYPVNAYKSTSKIITFNATIIDNLQVKNVTLYIDGNVSEEDTSQFNGIYIFTKTLEEGNHNWSILAYDNESQSTQSSTRNLSIDSLYPIINISYPAQGNNFNYLTYLTNFTLNVTSTDVNLDKCWYNYNNTNITFNCTTGVLKTYYFNLTNQKNITIYANDTFGNINYSISTWTFDLFDYNNYTYSNNITESSSTTIMGKFETGTAISSSYLSYNNTNYSTAITSLGSNVYLISGIITSPSVTTNTNLSWFFYVNGINSTIKNQTVININLDNCSSYNYKLAIYYLNDESAQTLINSVNSTIETTIYLKTLSGDVVAEINRKFTGNSTPSICSENNLNESGLRFWEQSRYGSTGYVFEQHNVQNQSITTLPVNITLFDLLSTEATTFRINYKSSVFLPVSDAVLDIQRKYLGEGVFKSIESPITDSNGEASASYDLNAVIYRIVVKKNGITLSTFENIAIACENILTGDCNINLNERQETNLINEFDVENDFNYGLTQDNRTITLTFEIPSGMARTINLFVNQSSLLGNKTSCNQSLYSTSGQLQCTIADTLGDVYASVEININGELFTTGSTTMLEDRSTYFGTDNIVLTFFLVLSIILMLVSDSIMVLIGLIIGIVGSSLLLLLNSGTPFGTIPVLTYIIICVILLIVKISQRRDRGMS